MAAPAQPQTQDETAACCSNEQEGEAGEEGEAVAEGEGGEEKAQSGDETAGEVEEAEPVVYIGNT